MLRILFACCLIVWCCEVTKASVIVDTLYINRGTFATVNQDTFPFLSFDSTSTFSAQTKVFKLKTWDTLSLTVVNNDTIPHGFRIDALNTHMTLPAGGIGITQIHFSIPGVYIYRDPIDNPNNRYLGLSGMFTVDNSNAKKFYWQLREHEKEYNIAIANGQNVNWSTYTPDYFTVNGLSFPDLQNDGSARVLAGVGDTIHIFIINSGQSAHSIHFHGFHCKVLRATDAIQQGRIKDTFPLRSLDGTMLELVPDKTGEYSVHDHNLVAITAGGTHPNGMFLIMKIQ